MTGPYAAPALLIALALLAWRMQQRQRRDWLKHLEPQPILTANEREFYSRLSRALPDYHIFPQVALSALMRLNSGLPRGQHYRARGQFIGKYADFVICRALELSRPVPDRARRPHPR